MRLAAGSGPRGLLLVLLVALAVFNGSAQLTNNGEASIVRCGLAVRGREHGAGS